MGGSGIVEFPIFHDVGNVFAPLLVEPNSFESGSTIDFSLSVCLILAARRCSKVLSAIIERISIAMVNQQIGLKDQSVKLTVFLSRIVRFNVVSIPFRVVVGVPVQMLYQGNIGAINEREKPLGERYVGYRWADRANDFLRFTRSACSHNHTLAQQEL